MCLFEFWDGDYVSQLPYVRYVIVKSSFKQVLRNSGTRGPMCFMCLLFILSGLFFDFCFVLLPLGPELWRVWCFCISCVALLMDCSPCVLRVCKLFDETIRSMFGCACFECYGSVLV